MPTLVPQLVLLLLVLLRFRANTGAECAAEMIYLAFNS
jgi:hypothetical protein